MKVWYQPPGKMLDDYVRTVLVIEGFSRSGPRDLPLVTNGVSTFHCSLQQNTQGDNQVARLMLYGKAAPNECWQVRPDELVICFFFRPFAMASVFDVPAARLIESAVDIRSWLPHQANALVTQLLCQKTTPEKIDVLVNFLEGQLRTNVRNCEIIKCATDEIMEHPGKEVLAELLQKLGLNQRTFQRLFKKYVGVAPNQYRRICQFQQTFSQVRTNDFASLSDVAYDNGFADQSHFIRSFREFTNTTPQHYLRSGLDKDK
jgi:AraC-like DNA-binding protein